MNENLLITLNPQWQLFVFVIDGRQNIELKGDQDKGNYECVCYTIIYMFSSTT